MIAAARACEQEAGYEKAWPRDMGGRFHRCSISALLTRFLHIDARRLEVARIRREEAEGVFDP